MSIHEVFSDPREATLRTARNYHRIEQLARKGSRSLNEETITDLLTAEMAGTEYVVDANCPGDAAPSSCLDWDGHPLLFERKLSARALTKFEEGGRKNKKKGTGADFILSVDHHEPDRGEAEVPQLRLLVQAKKANLTRRFLVKAKEVNQYEALLAAAKQLGAAPYYAVYVQQPDAHSSSPTRCEHHTAAADRAIVLVPARSKKEPGYLPGMNRTDVISLGRPFRCLGGCACTATPADSPVWTAVNNFITEDFGSSLGRAQPDSESHEGLVTSALSINSAVVKLVPSPRRSRAARTQGGAPERDTMLIVRLGSQARARDDNRGYIGYSPRMTEDQLREAASRYWRAAPSQAQRVNVVVAAAFGEALRSYQVREEGVTYTTDLSGNRRAAFDITDIEDPELGQFLLDRANQALRRLGPGARNPIHYVDLSAKRPSSPT